MGNKNVEISWNSNVRKPPYTQLKYDAKKGWQEKISDAGGKTTVTAHGQGRAALAAILVRWQRETGGGGGAQIGEANYAGDFSGQKKVIDIVDETRTGKGFRCQEISGRDFTKRNPQPVWFQTLDEVAGYLEEQFPALNVPPPAPKRMWTPSP